MKSLLPAFLALLMLSVPASLAARSEDADSLSRPVASVYSLEIGATAIADTYLSPLRYHGASWTFSGSWAKALPADPKLLMQFDASASYRHALNPSHTASMLGLGASFSWGLQRRWRLAEGFVLQAGGELGVDAGVLYIPRNSNNPASAKFTLSTGPTARVARPIRIGSLPILLADRLALPSLSLFFAPQYGEPYYEIYLGNHSGLAHAGWWGNHFCIDNLLTADLDFGRTALRIGYRFSFRSSYVSHINFQDATHSLVIGVTPGGIGLKPRKPSHKTAIINASY